MRFAISEVDGCLRAELVGRETIAETREFVSALAARALASRCTGVLIRVRDSRSIFQVEKYGISDWFRQLAAHPHFRVALLADTSELRAAHEYIQMLAQQQRANIRAFRDEAAALDWLVPGKPVEQAEPAGSPGLGA
jgi:hypothetical protein